MGVAGLWDVLRPVGKPRALTHLAVVDGFEANLSGVRGFRVGIDASIWFYHATYGREGENPELRTLFFRCARLMSTPFLPLFVFDGPKRPKVKRGKRISGKDHWMVQGMQRMIDAFGFEWRMAPGEAEAELAYLNRIGVIDAVLSDDVDTFLFGATMVVRNPSATLSGNKAHPVKNSAGKTDDQHVVTYSAKDFREDPDITLTEGGLILIGVLRGGDYHQGLNGCGVTTAHGLAKCGFGDSLVKSARSMSEDELEEWLEGWREDIRKELRSNSQGRLGRKCPSLAKALPNDFPNVEVLLSYTNPITSESYGKTVTDFNIDWEKEPDLGKIASVCEQYFEWGVKEIIIKRFRTVIWPPAVLRILRRSALLADKRAKRFGHDDDGDVVVGEPSTPKKRRPKQPRPFGSPSKMIARHFSSQSTTVQNSDSDVSDGDEEDNLIKKIHSSRNHASTDGVLEYRLEIAPAPLIALAESGIRGDRKAIENNMDEFDSGGSDDDDDEGCKSKLKKPPPEPTSHLRVWMPACMVKIAEPRLVEEFEAREQAKREKKLTKGSRTTGSKGKNKAASDERLKATSKATRKKYPPIELEIADWSDMDVPVPGPSKAIARVTTHPAKPKPAVPSGPSNTMDGFFKASKAPPVAKSKSMTSTVTSLFENFEPPPRRSSPIMRDLDDTDEDGFGSSLRQGKASQSKNSRPRAPTMEKSKSTSILSLFDRPSSRSGDRARSQPMLLKAKARPFPVSFDSPPIQEKYVSRSPSPIRPTISIHPNTSSRNAKSPSPSSHTSNTDHLQKSPRSSQGSPPHLGRDYPYPDSDDEDQQTTITTLSRHQKSKARPKSKPREVIEISSDSDGPSAVPPIKPPIRTLSQPVDKTRPSRPKKPIAPATEIIDLT